MNTGPSQFDAQNLLHNLSRRQAAESELVRINSFGPNVAALLVGAIPIIYSFERFSNGNGNSQIDANGFIMMLSAALMGALINIVLISKRLNAVIELLKLAKEEKK